MVKKTAELDKKNPKKTQKRADAFTKKRNVHARRSGKKPRKAEMSEKKRAVFTCLRYASMCMVAAALFTGFYFLFIRPYAYRWKTSNSPKAYGVYMPEGYGVHGIDISHHQGDIDWEKLQTVREDSFPICFVFMKASEGGDFNDESFAQNFSQARRYGFVRGAYHFYNPRTDALRQADFFIRTVKLEPGDLPPVLDIETKTNNMAKLRRDLKLWLDRVERHYKVKPILYASYKFKTKYLNDSVFNSYPYWIAHYYVDSVEYRGKWNFWQHTDVGTLPGIDEHVDLNVFNGTYDELKRMTIPAENNIVER